MQQALGLRAEDVKAWFGSLDAIRTFHESFVVDLEKAVAESARLTVSVGSHRCGCCARADKVGICFLKLGPFLKLYTAYVSGHEETRLAIQINKRENPKFAAHLADQAVTKVSAVCLFPRFLSTPLLCLAGSARAEP